MPDVETKRAPRWPLMLVLSLLILVEVLLVFLLIGERDADNIVMIVNSVGLIVLSVLVWRGAPWSRWLLIAFLVWRVAGVGISAASHFGPGDHRLGGSLVLAAFYVVVGLLIASPLGRTRGKAARAVRRDGS